MRFPDNRRCNDGSVLIVTLIIALLLGLSLTSYLLLVRAQSVSVARSQAWHAALVAAESGVEEALAQLNGNPLATNINFIVAWRPDSTGYRLSTQRKLGTTPPIGESGYTVALKSTVPPGPYVTICATGYATLPLISATITRVLEVRATNVALFSLAAAARAGIELNGKNLESDSFDSSNPYRSSSGKYDPTKIIQPRDGKGDVAANNGLSNYATVDIHGELLLGTGATNSFGWGVSASDGIHHDFNSELPDLSAPTLTQVSPIKSGTNSGIIYTCYLTGGNYQTNYLNGSIYVPANAQAVLYVTGNATISRLEIGNNARLTLYVGGGNATLKEIVVPTPRNFQYRGLAGNTNIVLTDYDTFTGSIYAPNATFHAGNKVNPGETFIDVDVYGALVVKAIDMKSALKLHFDESLQTIPVNGPGRGYIVTSWREVH